MASTSDPNSNPNRKSNTTPVPTLASVFQSMFKKSSPPVNQSSVEPNHDSESDYEPDPDLDPEPESGVVKVPQESLNEEERNRVATILEDGFKLLFSGSDDDVDPSSSQRTLLGLQVILEREAEDVQTIFKELADDTNRDKIQPYKLQAENAIGLLLDYEEFWTHTCSIVLSKLELDHLRERVSISKLCHPGVPDNNKSKTAYTEVMLFILANGQLNDKTISDKKQFIDFLLECEKKIQRVYATCSTVSMKDYGKTYSHLAI